MRPIPSVLILLPSQQVDTLVKLPNKRRSAILSKNSDIITQRLREGDELQVLDLLALLVQKCKY